MKSSAISTVDLCNHLYNHNNNYTRDIGIIILILVIIILYNTVIIGVGVVMLKGCGLLFSNLLNFLWTNSTTPS